MKKDTKSLVILVGAALVIILGLYALQGASSQSTQRPLSPSLPTPALHTTPLLPTQSTSLAKPTVSMQKAVTASVSSTLGGKTFRVTTYDAFSVPSDEVYTVSFSGSTIQTHVCNIYAGSYSAANGVLTTYKFLKTTQLGCSTPADINAVEQILNNVLSQISSYTYSGQTLTVMGSGHTLVFTRTS